MNSHLRIVHPPSGAANPTQHPVVVLSIDAKKLLFNVPEGTVRTMTQRKTSVGGPKMSLDVFASDAGDSVRGLGGFLMTMADGGKDKVRLHGPPSLAHALATMRFFAKRSTCELQIRESPDITQGHGTLSVPEPLLQEGKLAVRGLLSWAEGWDVDQALDPRRGPRAPSSRKRPRSPDLALTNNAEYDAVVASEESPLSTPPLPSLHNTQDRVLATVHDMFHKSSARQSGDRPDDPSAVPKGRAFSAAWDFAQLPSPCVSPFASGEGVVPSQPLALSYAITLPSRAGKVDIEKAKTLGLKPGPEIARLQAGQSVTISRPVGWFDLSKEAQDKWLSRKNPAKKGKGKGKKAAQETAQEAEPEPEPELEQCVIASADCVAPEVPGPVVFMISLPSPAHITSFLSEENAKVIAEATRTRSASVVIHASALSVLRDDRYQAWTRSVSTSDTVHVYSAPELGHNKILHHSAVISLLRLSSLDPTIFRVPPYSLTATQGLEDILPSGIAPSKAFAVGLDQAVGLQPQVTAPFVPHENNAPEGPIISKLQANGIDFDVTASSGPDFDRKMQLLSFGTFDAAGEKCATASTDTPHDGTSVPAAPDAIQNDADTREEDAAEASRRDKLQKARREAYLEFKEVSDNLREQVSEADRLGQGFVRDAWEGIRVTTLGTGSSQPTKYRGLSGTLLKLPGRLFKSSINAASSSGQDATSGDADDDAKYVLLDAGEGTLGQLRQMYGTGKKLESILRNLKVFFVSHIHGDHCMGVAKVLRARAELQPPPAAPLYLIANSFTRRFLEEWNDLESIGLAGAPQLSSGNPGQVIMIESEHLDYDHGVAGRGTGGPLSIEGAGPSSESAYISHLESGFKRTRTKWLERIRREVLQRQPFAGLDEDDLVAEADEVDREVERVLKRERASGRRRNSDTRGDAIRSYERFKRTDRDAAREALRMLQADLGEGVAVDTVEVEHRARHCYGIVVRLNLHGEKHIESEGATADPSARRGFSFAYSGDTQPTVNLEKAAEGVDLLIHEATMQDEESQLAAAKGHSTVGGAIASGRRMSAGVTLLTHFSQRYPMMARLNLDGQGGPAEATETQHNANAVNGMDPASEKDAVAEAGHENPVADTPAARAATRRPIVAIGMDLLELGMNDMWKMERYLPAMEVLFRADAVIGEEEGESPAEAEAEAEVDAGKKPQ